MQYSNFIFSGLVLFGLVSSHANVKPRVAKPDTAVEVVLNLPHSCQVMEGEIKKVSKTNKVIIYYPEELIKNKLIVDAKAFKASKKTEFKQITEPVPNTQTTPNNPVPYNPSDQSTLVKPAPETHAHHVHRRHETAETPVLGVTYENLSEEKLDFNLSFKTPKIDQITGDVKAIFFKVDQFCENGQVMRWTTGDAKYPPAKLEIKSTEETTTPPKTDPNAGNPDKSSANGLFAVSLMTFIVPIISLTI